MNPQYWSNESVRSDNTGYKYAKKYCRLYTKPRHQLWISQTALRYAHLLFPADMLHCFLSLCLSLPVLSCLSLSLFITFSSSLSPCTTKKMITSTKALGIKAARDGAQKAKKKRSRSERTACLLPTKTAKQYIKSSQAFSTLVGREGGWTVVTGADLCECGEMWTVHGRVQERRGIKVPVRRCWVEPCLSHACTHSEDTHILVHIFYIGADD